MHNKRRRIVVGLLAVYFVALLSAYAQGEKTKVKGLITARYRRHESVCYKVLIRPARCLDRARYSDMFHSSKQLRGQTKNVRALP